MKWQLMIRAKHEVEVELEVNGRAEIELEGGVEHR